MIREIVKDKEALAIPSEPATIEDAEIAQDLVDSVLGTEDCACLAANQIGYNKCIIAYLDSKDRIHVMYNPKIKVGMRGYRVGEMCLSVEEETMVNRFQFIQVIWEEPVDGKLVKRNGRFEEWTAQMIQHCIDHCKGKVI